MIIGLGVVLVLALVLAQLRGVTAPPRGRGPRGSSLEWGLAAITLLVLHAPLLRELLARPGLVGGDTPSHWFVAEHALRDGWAHGWVDAVSGGFPIGPHYPLSSTVAIGVPVALGVPARTAAVWVGVVALVATAFLVLRLGRGLGLTPGAALVVAALAALIAPHNCFIGGWESVLVMGLMAQVLSIPFLVLLVHAIACPGSRAGAPVTGGLLAMAHPQVAIATLAVVGVIVLVAGDRSVLVRYLRAAVAAAVVAAAVFGPGVVSLDVPFGWPPMLDKRRLGYGPTVFWQTLSAGEWFDRDRVAIATHAAFLALAWHLAMVRRRGSRLALVGVAAVLCVSLGGRMMASWGRLGELLLAFLQPLRAAALMPLALGLLVGLAWNDAGRFALRGYRLALRRWRRRAPLWLRRRVPAVAGLAAAMGFCLALYPGRRDWLTTAHARDRGDGTGPRCGAVTASDIAALRTWLGALGGGRLEVSESLASCLNGTGALYESRAPLGRALGVGAHVGVMVAAFSAFDAGRTEAAAQAEALGIRYYLHRGDEPPSLADRDWEPTHQRAALVLSTRRGGTDLVGVGCVAERWSGSDTALRVAVLEDLRGPRRSLMPASVVVLEETAGAVVRTQVDPGQCDPKKARVTAERLASGEYRAQVTTPVPVDVVFRVSAFPTWRLHVDGSDVPRSAVVKVAPGFIATRVPPGTHEVLAVVSPPRFYWWGVLGAWLVVVVLAIPRARGLVESPANRA